MSSKYLTKDELDKLIGNIVYDPTFMPLSQDSYNEAAIIQAIMRTKRVEELLYATINMACIGYGNKKYGYYKLKDKIVDIAQLLMACGVKLSLPKDSKLAEDDLTPQRLCRALRNQVREYIKAKGFETYLYRKYSDHQKEFADVMFRGAEYLDELNPDQVNAILHAHQALDAKLNTNVVQRIERVFKAKGYLQRVVV